jgi:hypothetical protein
MGSMHALSVVLLLISIGTIVGPIGAVAIMYRDNLVQLVVPPQISNLINGNNNVMQDNGNNNNNNDNGNNNSGGGGLINPVFVGAQINSEARTFTVTVNVTNSFSYDLTLNSINATVESSQDNYQLGTISLTTPVTILAGQTSAVTVSGAWTQDAENYVLNNYGGATSIDVNLVNTTVDVNGIVIQETQPINIGNILLN